jgi:surface antigen
MALRLPPMVKLKRGRPGIGSSQQAAASTAAASKEMDMQATTWISRPMIAAALLVVGASLGACTNTAQFFPTSPAQLEDRLTMDDGRLAGAALVAMLNDGANTPRNWSNSGNGHAGTLTPVRAFTSEAGLRCVEYRDTFTIGGDTATAINTACQGTDRVWSNLNADGRWQRIG